MNNTDIVQSIFAAVDQRDAESFAAFFTEDGVFRFANQNLVIGKVEIQLAVAGFFQSLKSIEERGFNNIRKFDAGFWFHRGTRKTGA